MTCDPQDIIGKQFGRLTVIKCYDSKKNNRYYYLCNCECGETKEASRTNLIHNNITSCGCLRKELWNLRRKEFSNEIDYTQYIGQIYTRWKVIEFVEIKDRAAIVRCLCECGTIRKVKLRSLKNGTSKSCGCFKQIIKNYDLSDAERTNQRDKRRFKESEIKIKILSRDNFECFICKTTIDLEIHHIESWEEKPELRFNLSNLITVCSVCHFNYAHSGNFCKINDEWKKKFMDYTFSFDLAAV